MTEKFLIFPTPLIKVKLNEDLNELKEFSKTLSAKVNLSNVGGKNSGQVDFKKKPLISLSDKITKIANDNFVEDLALDRNLNIENMWFNINGHKAYNTEHLHMHFLVSGVFYVDVQKNSGDLILHRNSWAHCFTVTDNSKSYNLFTSSTKSITPENNMLILFPSWLVHSVNPNLSNEKRISIAFDLR